MATDREEIKNLKRRVDELSGEVHTLKREFRHSVGEIKEALRFLWEVIQTLHKPGHHPTPGPTAKVMIESEPVPPIREDSPT